ncbi:MAG: hypothetical protein GXP45_04805 [bacterium]|nr:hypothetical protein [bacterium]
MKTIVHSYNQKLQIQLDARNSYYNNIKGSQTPNAFTFLSSVDTLANPLRNYSLLDENYFIDLLGEDKITLLAKLLYFQNLPWQERKKYDSVADTLDNLRSSFDINAKISNVVSNYLKADNDQGPILSPDYSSGAYELAYINSDGNDYLSLGVLPEFVDKVNTYSDQYQEKQDQLNSDLKKQQSTIEQELSTECDVPSNGRVPLFKWPDAFVCWLKVTLKKPLEFSIDFRDAQGPVFGNFLDDLRGSFTSYQEQIDAYKNDWDSYKDEWKRILPYKEPGDPIKPNSYDIPNTVTVQQNVDYLILGNSLMQEQNNTNTIQSLSPDLAKNLQEVLSYTIVKLDIKDPRVDSFSGKFELYSTRDF